MRTKYFLDIGRTKNNSYRLLIYKIDLRAGCTYILIIIENKMINNIPEDKSKGILMVDNIVEIDNNIIETPKKVKKKRKLRIKDDEKLVVLDLFCGCGGMSKGLQDAGLNVVAGLDIWDKAIDSYKANHNHTAICDDINKLPPELFKERHMSGTKPIDLLVGGPPCQGFSIAGKRDIKDPRNSLFMEYVKYLNYFNPKAFIMENVMGILSMKNAEGVKVINIIMDLLGTNYNCVICKLYASDFEVPQNRRRVIIIGIRKDLNKYPTEPITVLEKEDRIPVSSILLPRAEVDERNYLSEKALAGIRAKKEKAKKNGNGFGAQFLKMDKPSYTIPARYWKDGYDALVKYSETEVRRLTILELKRIQSFPDDYILIGSKKDQIMQIGNAVACRFAYHLGKHIISALQ